MEKPNRYKMQQDGLCLWLITQYKLPESIGSPWGFDIFFGQENSLDTPDIAAKIECRKIGFLFVDVIDKAILNQRIKNVSNLYEQICVVIFNSRQRAELVKAIPKACGILCISDSFGMGIVCQKLRWF